MRPRLPDDTDLILHVGAPKTGSSAIQRHLCRHARELRDAGLHYPEHPLDANGVSGGHGELFTLLLGGQASSARQAIACHLGDARRLGCRLMLSAEGIFDRAADVVPLLPPSRLHVVCFLRHPVDAIASHHNQGIKRHFGTEPLSQAVEAIVSGEMANRGLTGEVLFDWLRACGRERITVLPYVEDGMTVDAVGRLCEFLGLPRPPAEPLINRSYTPAAVAFKRLVNRLPEPLIAAVDEALDRSLQTWSDSRGEARPKAADTLDPDRLAAFERHVAADVARLEAAFGLTLERCQPIESKETPSDAIEDVWRHVRRDADLAARLRAAVAEAARRGVAAEGFDDLVRLVGLADS